MTLSMAIRSRAWGVGKLLMLLGALLATFGLSAVLGMRYALRAREVVVPDLAGLPVYEATRLLEDQGLALRIDRNRRYDSRLREDLILQQDPPAGAQARQQRTIRVWLSAGVRTVSVPTLVGQSERGARIRLDQDGLTLDTVATINVGDTGTDTVLAQTPPPSSRDNHVALLVARADALTLLMPDLLGTDGEAAATALRAHGLRVTLTQVAGRPGAVAGAVVRQQPPAGLAVGPAIPILLDVSR